MTLEQIADQIVSLMGGNGLTTAQSREEILKLLKANVQLLPTVP